MAASTHVDSSRPDQSGEQTRLDSWKEIAAHFGRDVRTVQRWEKHEGLPVHRHLHQKRGSVQAIVSELDAWLQVRRAAGEPLDAQRRWYERKRLVAVSVCGLLAVVGVVVLAFGAGWFSRSADGGALRRSSSAAARATDPVLVQLLERGRLYQAQFTPEGARKAIATFEEAVTRAPDSAEAQAGLAMAHIGAINRTTELPRVHGERAQRAAARAMQLDSLLPDAHAAAGLVHDFHRDWEHATAAFAHALEMRPNDAQVRAWYAIALARRRLFDQALSEVRKAHLQQPLSLPIHAQVGWILFWQGRTQLAIDEWRKALDTDPNFPLAHYNLGLGYTRLGLYRRAIGEFDRALTLVPNRLPYITQLAQAHARAGDRVKAQWFLRAVEERATRERVSGYQLAIVYSALGQNESAIRELERAEHEQDPNVANLRLEPFWFTSLADNSRFQALARRLDTPMSDGKTETPSGESRD